MCFQHPGISRRGAGFAWEPSLDPCWLTMLALSANMPPAHFWR